MLHQRLSDFAEAFSLMSFFATLIASFGKHVNRFTPKSRHNNTATNVNTIVGILNTIVSIIGIIAGVAGGFPFGLMFQYMGGNALMIIIVAIIVAGTSGANTDCP